MNLHALESLPQARVLQPDAGDEPTLRAAYTSDLLSDVIAHCPGESVLITLQAHMNTVAVATLAGVRAILICHNRPISGDMLEAARRERIALVVTAASQYEASWRVRRLLEADAP
jgi:hypothetical protein